MSARLDQKTINDLVEELRPICVGDRLTTLRDGLSTAVMASLPRCSVPSDMLMSDLLALARAPEMAEELRSYLLRAHRMLASRPTPRLDDALARLGGTPSGPARLSVQLDRLERGSHPLQGRHRERGRMDAAWSDPKARLMSVLGPGGIGKSTLITDWALRRADEARDRNEALSAFGWCFRDPTAGVAESDTIEQLLTAMERWARLEVDPPVDARTRSRRVASRLGDGAVLIVLDGAEVLDGGSGFTIDDLLFCLRDTLGPQSLCIIGSRSRRPRLATDPRHVELPLHGLDDAAGIAHLKQLGLEGDLQDFAAAVRDLGGHPLALDLLGHYLRAFEDRDMRRRDRVDLGTALANLNGHEQRVARLVDAYEGQLGETEKAVMESIALFARDADEPALAAALAGDARADAPQELSRAQRRAVQRLHDLGLVTRQRNGRLRLHPLVRGRINQRMRSSEPSAWQRRHGIIATHRLRRACRAGARSHRRHGRGLIEAIRHACAAGWSGGALRIYRQCLFGEEHPISDEQGALSQSLEALLPFFDRDHAPLADLEPSDRASVAGKLGFRLQALGRLREAVHPMRLSAATRIELREWTAAANSAGNLSSLMLTLGCIDEAIEWGARAVRCADEGGDGRQRVSKRAIRAEALHRSGALDAAEHVFREAEQIQAVHRPGRPVLGSIMSYRFGTLLAHLGRLDEVERRARADLEWSRHPSRRFRLAQALDHLLIGQCHRRRGDLAGAEVHLDESVRLLEKTGRLDHQPRGLIARAVLRFDAGRAEDASSDLDDATEIASLSGMRLFLLDIRVQRLRMNIDASSAHPADFDALRDEIDEVGYACARGNLAALQLGSR